MRKSKRKLKLEEELNELKHLEKQLDSKYESEQISRYQMYLQEKKQILSELSEEERKIIEINIKSHILRMFIQAGIDAKSDNKELGFFRYEDIYKNKYIEKYFNILITNGDRNIGKTYSSRRMIRDSLKKGHRFMIWRNTEEQVKAQIASDSSQAGWLTSLGLTVKGSRTPDVFDIDGNLVGYYRAINTSGKFRSVDYPDVDIIVYEEFAESERMTDKAEKMLYFLSTVQRHREKMKLILQSNYTNQNDEILQYFGLGNKKLDGTKGAVFFNWEVGVIIINVPKDTYRKPTNTKKDVARRAALGKFEVYQGQYGGGFQDEEPVNIINERDIVNSEPILNIHLSEATRVNAHKSYGAYKITLYNAYFKDNTQELLMRRKIENNNAPIFVLDKLNLIREKNAHLLKYENLKQFIALWGNGQLKTVSIEDHEIITTVFAKALEKIEKDKDVVDEIN